MKQQYLSEEELEKLIDNIEKEPLYRAPDYLKPEILKRARQNRIRCRMQSKEIQLFTYSIKIVAAAAAAVIMVMTMPVRSKNEVVEYQEQQRQAGLERRLEVEEQQTRLEDWGRRFRTEVTDFCQDITVTWQERIWNKNNFDKEDEWND